MVRSARLQLTEGGRAKAIVEFEDGQIGSIHSDDVPQMLRRGFGIFVGEHIDTFVFVPEDRKRGRAEAIMKGFTDDADVREIAKRLYDRPDDATDGHVLWP